MADGSYKRIDQLQVGDYVAAKDEFDNTETSSFESGLVTEVFVHQDKEVLRLHLAESFIDTTEIHPFYVVDRGWTEAGEIEAGDVVISADGSRYTVEAREFLVELDTVYNIEVEDFHTFFIGELNIWVHNKDYISVSSGGGQSQDDGGGGDWM